MRVLFATTNPAKVKKYKERLAKEGIEIITIKDLSIKLDIEETGKDAIENAYIKAKSYYDETKIPTIGLDDNLFIEDILPKDQPGTKVRRINGKELTDEEMIEHYTNLVKKYGKKLSAKWVYGMVIYKDDIAYKYTWSKENFYFADTPSGKINKGYPLDSISIVPKLNKYFVDLTKEEKEEYQKQENFEEVINFIVKSLKK